MRKKGFTLIEVLVVIFIIGLLAAIIVVSASYARQKSRDGQRVSYLNDIAVAMQNYYIDNGHHFNPGRTGACSGDECADDFDLLVQELKTNNYLTSTLDNPYPSNFANNDFNYQYCTLSPNCYWIWFRPEQTQNASCNQSETNPVACDSLSSHALYVISSGKIKQ